MDYTKDEILSITERLAGNWFGVHEQYVPNIRGSRIFVSVSVFAIFIQLPRLCDLSFYFSIILRDTRRQYDIIIAEFRRLINALEELSVLKIRFNLTLTFDDYINVSLSTRVHSIYNM